MTYELDNPSSWIEFSVPVNQRFDDPITKLQNRLSHCMKYHTMEAYAPEREQCLSQPRPVDQHRADWTSFPWIFWHLNFDKTSSDKEITSAL